MEFFFDFIRHTIQQLVQQGLLPESLKYSFVINALLAALMSGPILGFIGTTVVSKRMAFFSSAIGNATLTGIAIGILLGEPVQAPYISLFSFAVLFAILLNFLRHRTNMSNDTLIGVFLAASLAIGSTLVLAITRDINLHTLDEFLFGNILTLTTVDLTLLFFTSLATLAAGIFGFNYIMLSGLNPSLAHVRKVPVKTVNYLFVVFIALITVASVKVIGAVLVQALLVIPAASAANVSKSLKGFTFYSTLFATISAAAGILIPAEMELNIPSGGAIIIAATIIFIATFYIKLLKKF
ncbi:metal ABC transporter permease [Chitinivibrio alkaliphilus]|uniref:ABC-type Mn2+/Zn2+ transport system, permease component n=1 Tax=Chitinivibrio alkaliphilus ACht1 TaxID=1313304 RepID=U7DA83_9BACT|nr:metal ABC transporter permease [Chitinivibrio alkaliphilus]ERP32037.1 ABC-type Mn2+/Zn2+ transport system, permease component [Chitinivibrio alkaliphilus ACht1]